MSIRPPITVVQDLMGTFVVKKQMGPRYQVTYYAAGSESPIELDLQKEVPSEAGPISELEKVMGQIGRIIMKGFRAEDFTKEAT